jgi:adenine-specific DNA-methyltransferase
VPTGSYSHARKKELGAFYTPGEMAAKLVEWCIRSPKDTMLDPSFGGFVFLEAARERLLALGANRRSVGRQLCGIDVDEDAVRMGRDEEGLADCRLLHADFFRVAPSEEMRFAANIGNPPYVRYQSWNGGADKAHALTEAMGVRLTRLASTWAPFILHGCCFLHEGGRMGQVLPAELLHSQYAKPVIDYLVSSFRSVTVAVFEEKVFPGALEEVVLLFADGYGHGPARGVRLVACRNLDDVTPERIDGRGRGYLDLDLPLLRLLPKRTQRLYEQLAADTKVEALGSIAAVDIGLVTGANDFFIRTRDEVKALRYDPRLFRAAISKATDIEGARFSRRDLRQLDRRGRRTALLDAAGASPRALATVQDLIRKGEKAKLHKRYKCRIRDPWYAVPIPKSGVPDAFLTYMNNAFPRLVVNDARALSTNTIHKVSLLNGHLPSALGVAFYNSLTLLSAELVGRSYGGGILKLEPTEAERLLIPSFAADIGNHLEDVDAALRRGDLNAALDLVDAVVLKPLGVTPSEIAALRRAREKLFGRRRTRNIKALGAATTNTPAADRRAEASRRRSRRS